MSDLTPKKEVLPKQRTELQNNALHLYFEMIAKELQNQGQTMQNVVKKFDFCEITPTKQSVKDIIWRPIMETVVSKKSTTELTKHEVTEVYEIVSMFLSKQFGISIPFPNDEDIAPLKV